MRPALQPYLQHGFGDLLELFEGEDGAVFADVVWADVAAAALADAARHLTSSFTQSMKFRACSMSVSASVLVTCPGAS